MNEAGHAALRGAIASAAMTGMRVVTTSVGLVSESPPQQIAGQAKGFKRAAVEVAHWGFGAAGAVAFSQIPKQIRQRSWTGPVYGLAMWTSFEAVAPLLGLPHARGTNLIQRVAVAADHLLYGFVLDEMRRAPQDE